MERGSRNRQCHSQHHRFHGATHRKLHWLQSRRCCLASLQDGGCTQTWTQSVSSGNKEWLLSGRVDYSFGDNDKIFGRVRFDRGTQPTYTDSINPAFNDLSVQPQNEGQLNYTHIFSPTVVNNFIGSVLYYSAIFGSTTPGPALSLFPGNLAFPLDGALTAWAPVPAIPVDSRKVSCIRRAAASHNGNWWMTFLSRVAITASRWA